MRSALLLVAGAAIGFFVGWGWPRDEAMPSRPHRESAPPRPGSDPAPDQAADVTPRDPPAPGQGSNAVRAPRPGIVEPSEESAPWHDGQEGLLEVDFGRLHTSHSEAGVRSPFDAEEIGSRADKDGTVRFELMPGVYEVRCRVVKGELAPRMVRARILPARVTRIDVAGLPSGEHAPIPEGRARVMVQVLDREGLPVRGLRVLLQTRSWDSAVETQGEATDHQGRCFFLGFAGPVAVTVGMRTDRLEAPEGRVTSHEVRARDEGTLVVQRDLPGRIVVTPRHGKSRALSIQQAQDGYRIPFLTEGWYQVAYLGGSRTAGVVHVTARATVWTDFTVPNGSVVVQVGFQGGDPARRPSRLAATLTGPGRKRVRFHPEGARSGRVRVTTPTVVLTFRSLRAGNYRLLLRASGFLDEVVPVEVADGQAEVSATLLYGR